MKKMQLLLIILALQSVNSFSSEEKGLIFWTDFNYYKNNEIDYKIKRGGYFKLEESETPDIQPPPIVPNPKPTPNPSIPAPPKYIFYNKVFYEGNNLFTGQSPLGGDLTLSAANDIGMGSIMTGYTITNNNTITLNTNPEYATMIGMQGSGGGEIVNGTSGTIDVNSFAGVGMSIEGKGRAVNHGVINVSDVGNGIQLSGDSTGENSSSGTINLDDSQAMGVYVSGGTSGTKFENNGTIAGYSFAGMNISGLGTLENNGTISNTNGYAGIYVINGGTGINRGDITMADGRVGMYVSKGSITNDGTITMTTLNSGNNALLYPSSGMHVSNSGTAINNGTINIGVSTTDTIQGFSGMAGVGNVVLENNGNINLYATDVSSAKNSDVFDFAFNLSSGAVGVNKASGTINLGENGFLVTGGNLYNWGKIVINLNNNGVSIPYNKGKLIMEKGGTITPLNLHLKQDIYIGQSYLEKRYTDSAILNLDQSIIDSAKSIKSNSIVYDIETENGLILSQRKNFKVLTNDSIGEYLEDIYYDSNSGEKDDMFDALISADNNQDFEKRVDEIFGRKYFPTLIYQTKDAITFGNDTIIDQISRKTQATGKESYILGYSFEKFRKGSRDGNLGYDESLNSVFLGKNYPLNSELSTGWILSYTRMDSDFKEGAGKREDNLFQGTGYLNYNKDDVNAFGGVFLGYSKGDLTRDVNLEYLKYNGDLTGVEYKRLNESLNSDIKNWYVGGMGKVSKVYNLSSIFIEPEGRIESMGVFQKRINEGGGTYNLDIDEMKGFLNTAYIGADIGRVFDIHKTNLKLSINAGLKQDLNSIDDNIKFKIKSLGEETGKIDIENKNRFSQELGMKVEVGNLWNGLSVYGDYKYYFSKDDSWKVSAGLSYVF